MNRKLELPREMSAKLIRIVVQQGHAGLLYATSPDLDGLLIAKPTVEDLNREIPRVIKEFFELANDNVVALQVENQGSPAPWVVIPARLVG